MTEKGNYVPASAKQYNIIRVIQYLREMGEATVSDISQTVAIPLATVYRIVHKLLEEGLILQTKKILSENGRQPTLYSINPSFLCAICITVEKTAFTVCLTDMKSTILQMEKTDIGAFSGKNDILEGIHRAMHSVAEAQWPGIGFPGKVRAIHVAVEADVDSVSGCIVRFSGASYLDDFGVVEYFENRYGIPTKLKKLLDVEAVASIRSYCRYSFSNYIYLHIGVGYGATIVINRQIYTGANGKAGELVRLKTGDGRTWEEAYGTYGLYQRLLKVVADQPGSQLNTIMMEAFRSPASGEVSFMGVLDRALEVGCPEAIEMVDEAARGWAVSIHWLNALFDPEVIVVGGDISSSMPHVFALIRKCLKQDTDFDGVVLPAQYEAPLMVEVANDAVDTLYENVYSDYAASFVH